MKTKTFLISRCSVDPEEIHFKPVFQAMLEAGMREAYIGVINVTDMTSRVFGILLRYMCTMKVDPALDLDCLIHII